MVFRSEPFLERFIEATLAALAELGCSSFEIIFVVDGSPDRSLEVLLAQRAVHPQIRIAELSRNFGHHAAAQCGLSLARGERVFLIDCDLEVSPSTLVEFSQVFDRSDADVVYGFQEHRNARRLARVGGDIFWRLFNLTSRTPVPRDIVTERLMNRRYVEALLSLGDRNLFLSGMMYWAGFVQIGVPVVRQARPGPSSYTFMKRLALALEAITSFSALPLRLMFFAGVLLSLASGAYGLNVLVRKALWPDSIFLGWASLATLTAFMGGTILTSLGVMGLYIEKIFDQTKGRPNYIIRSLW